MVSSDKAFFSKQTSKEKKGALLCKMHRSLVETPEAWNGTCSDPKEDVMSNAKDRNFVEECNR